MFWLRIEELFTLMPSRELWKVNEATWNLMLSPRMVSNKTFNWYYFN